MGAAPAPGLRGYEHGKVRSVGYSGFCWASTAPGSNARYLHFNYSFLARQASKTTGGRVALPQGRVRASAPGFRDAGSFNGYGTLYSIGDRGYGWTSTEAGSNIYFLDFYCTGVVLQDKNFRATGLQLRCLQEEGGRWAPGRSLPVPRRGPTLSGRISLFPLPRSSRGGSYFL